MTDPTNSNTQHDPQGEPAPQQAPAPSDGTLNTDKGSNSPAPVPYDRFKTVNEQRAELEAKLKEYEQQEAQRKQTELEQQGKWQEIVEDLKPKAARVETLEATLKKYLDAEMQTIPDEYKDLVPQGDVSFQLDWIANAKAKGLLGRASAPHTDAGARGDNRDTIELTPSEMAMARAMNIDPKKMIDMKKREQRGN